MSESTFEGIQNSSLKGFWYIYAILKRRFHAFGMEIVGEVFPRPAK